jgi:hypothetical protein
MSPFGDSRKSLAEGTPTAFQAVGVSVQALRDCSSHEIASEP